MTPLGKNDFAETGRDGPHMTSCRPTRGPLCNREDLSIGSSERAVIFCGPHFD
jgi:hypothetical protein